MDECRIQPTNQGLASPGPEHQRVLSYTLPLLLQSRGRGGGGCQGRRGCIRQTASGAEFGFSPRSGDIIFRPVLSKASIPRPQRCSPSVPANICLSARFMRQRLKKNAAQLILQSEANYRLRVEGTKQRQHQRHSRDKEGSRPSKSHTPSFAVASRSSPQPNFVDPLSSNFTGRDFCPF